jgi:hypothetical protein
MERKTVGLDDVLNAIKIREQGGTWARVIAETGFNGATLRPHINRYLSRDVLKRERQVAHEDRVDSPYAVIESVELTTESIDAARKRGMSWYGIAEALGVSEGKAKGLASPESLPRTYAGRKAAPVVEPTPEEVKEAKRIEKNRKAAERRAAKKAAAAA